MTDIVDAVANIFAGFGGGGGGFSRSGGAASGGSFGSGSGGFGGGSGDYSRGGAATIESATAASPTIYDLIAPLLNSNHSPLTCIRRPGSQMVSKSRGGRLNSSLGKSPMRQFSDWGRRLTTPWTVASKPSRLASRIYRNTHEPGSTLYLRSP